MAELDTRTHKAVGADRAQAMANGLRQLARLIEGEPQLADHLRYALGYMHAPVSGAEDSRGVIAGFATVAARHGAKVTKSFSAEWGGIDAAFGPVVVHMYTHRADVCERVVVGTEQVTKEVPDPGAPKVTVTETVEQVEWRCHPLLSNALQGGAHAAGDGRG